MEHLDVTYTNIFSEYLKKDSVKPLFLCGDSLEVLRSIPSESIDCCMTSPPYWGKRQYNGGGVGLEKTHQEFIDGLVEIFKEVHRVLKPSGVFWLNIGDSYLNKRLLGIPWRLVFRLIDEQGWILRNSVVWNKVKSGMDNSKDKLGNVHEDVFMLVKNAKGYYFDADAIRSTPSEAKVVNGAVVSATGVSGVRYKRQIELSTELTDTQKEQAFAALEEILQEVRDGKLSDFRMIIKGQQRVTHSDSAHVSGRAKELQDKGYYFLKYHPKGSKPTDVWDIIPVDTHRKDGHFAAYPEDLCKIPILATCPPDGIVLDPFAGTGTTMLVAKQFNRKSVGVDISEEYIAVAEERCGSIDQSQRTLWDSDNIDGDRLEERCPESTLPLLG